MVGLPTVVNNVLEGHEIILSFKRYNLEQSLVKKRLGLSQQLNQKNSNANSDISSDTAPDGAIQDVKPTPQQGASLADVVQNPLLGEPEESK
ncbi:unnamed protein product [Trichobilharzia regenti]|uniref:Uncharacterized protein n=1 Tax=Trichobilharzia regenti TaxID=157069 RepID=A0A183X8J7_TRIRE|nr:unnamed protein product [Trichobilharzia regenti]VDQ16579.1 unnamed protein product [Trichobilharzia regenti]